MGIYYKFGGGGVTSSSLTPSSSSSQSTPSAAALACYRGDFSGESGWTQRGGVARPGRDRWHNPDGSIVNRLRDRVGECEAPQSLATVPEETQAESSGMQVPAPCVSAVSKPAEDEDQPTLTDQSTTAGEEGAQADTEAGLSSNSSSCNDIGFYRHGEWVPRARTLAEWHSHRGGQGDVRTKRKKDRMNSYFAGQWKPAWLVNYALNKSRREAAAGGITEEPATNNEEEYTQQPDAVTAVEDWTTWGSSSYWNNGEAPGTSWTWSYQSWQQWEEEWNAASSTTSSSSWPVLLATSSSSSTCWTSSLSLSSSWVTSTTTTTCTPSSTWWWPALIVDFGATWSSWTGISVATGVSSVLDPLYDAAYFLVDTVFGGLCFGGETASLGWSGTSTSSTSTTGPPQHVGLPNEGLFPHVTEADPQRSWRMEITNSEAALLQEHGLSAEGIARIEHLLHALDTHQDNGSGPESRWARWKHCLKSSTDV